MLSIKVEQVSNARQNTLFMLRSWGVWFYCLDCYYELYISYTYLYILSIEKCTGTQLYPSIETLPHIVHDFGSLIKEGTGLMLPRTNPPNKNKG